MDIEPDLSVCVVTGKRKNDLSRFLTAIHKGDDHLRLEVIVVNQHLPHNESAALPHDFSVDGVIDCPPGLSKPRAFNLALEKCRGRHISFWNQESRPEPDCLPILAEFLDENPDVGLTVPKLRNQEGLIQPVAHNLPGLLSFLYPMGIPGEISPGWSDYAGGEASWLTGPGLTVNRYLLEEVGRLSERLPTLWPLDLCLRAGKAGWHCFYRHDAQASADIYQWLEGVDHPGLQLWERLVVTMTRLRFIY